MRKLPHAAARAALRALLCMSVSAGASVPDEPTLIVVVPGGYALLGTTAANGAELLKLLTDRKIARVDLRTDGSTDYEKVGKAIYTLVRKGIDIVHVDGDDVKTLEAEHPASPVPVVPATPAGADK